MSLSYLAVPIDPGKTVATVALPAVGTAIGHTVPAMHIFALTIGTVTGAATDGPGAQS